MDHHARRLQEQALDGHTDKGIDFSKVLYLVDADDYARHVEGMKLLERYPDDAWQQLEGFGSCVGHLDDRPVMVTFWPFHIGTLTILFYSSDSQLTDWAMIDKWIDERYKGPKTNAMNMHNCLHEIERQREGDTARESLSRKPEEIVLGAIEKLVDEGKIRRSVLDE